MCACSQGTYEGIVEGLPAKPSEITDFQELKTQIARNPISWKTALDFMRGSDFANMEDGRYYLTEDSLTYANISTYDTRETGSFEQHRKYIDFQYMLEGREDIQVSDSGHLQDCIKEYSEESEASLYAVSTEYRTIRVDEKCFAILFPKDAHNPNLSVDGVGPVRKVVIKIPNK